MTLPNFIIIGAARSGTSAMTRFLQSHPEVCIPYKEPNFFSGWGHRVEFSGPNFPRPRMYPSGFPTLETYASLYSQAGDAKARGEASVSYLIDPSTPKRIADTLPDVKLIALLRQPADRAYAHFLFTRMQGVEPRSDFMACLRENDERLKKNWLPALSYVHSSLYSAQLARYFEHFDKSQIRIYLHEDWNESPGVVWQDLMRYLGIDNGFVPDFSPRINSSRLVKPLEKHGRTLKKIIRALLPSSLHEPIKQHFKRSASPPPPVKLDPGLRKELTDRYFREDILRLQDMLGRDLRHWLS